MSGDAYQNKVEAFAAALMVQAAWPTLLVAVAVMAAPVIGPVAAPQATAISTAAWLVAAASALATLAFSALLVFDALLFRLMASHASEAGGGTAVDDLLARMRLKPTPAGGRSLDQRTAGTRRLLAKQRIAFGQFAAASLVASFV
jgi:hypothetical protein